MNAPETIPAAYPINLAHEVLLKSDDAMCVDEVARAIIGKKPTKANIKPVAKLIKELADLGMIEMEPRTGGVPFYRLIVAGAQPAQETHETRAIAGAEGGDQIESTEPKADAGIPASEGVQASVPVLVLTPEAEAERDQFVSEYGYEGNCSCHIRPPCSSCTHPGNPRNQDEDESCWMPEPADSPSQPLNFGTSPDLQYLAPEDYEMPPADPALLASANRMLCDRLEAKDAELLAQAKVVVDLRDQLEKKIQDHAKEVSAVHDLLDDIIFEPFTSRLADHSMEALKEFKKVVAERDDLRDRLDALTQQWEADAGRITADLRAALESRSQVINEADRLRAELAAERQAREALQEQSDAVDVKDAAVGYLVRVTKRKPRYVTQPERARDAALAAVRAGAGRAEVLAVVPVGVARRGAEWRGSAPQTKGD